MVAGVCRGVILDARIPRAGETLFASATSLYANLNPADRALADRAVLPPPPGSSDGN